MGTVSASNLQGQLLHRRERLREAIERTGEAEDLVFLLQEVDAALDRITEGTYGVCEVCSGSIEDSDLMANPLMRYCLCDLSPEQQIALQNDLALASRIQAALLPEQDVSHAGWDAHYRYEPAGVVSGDYCDLLVPEGQPALYFAIGDVSGKGVAASLLMAQLNASIRVQGRESPPVTKLVETANRLLVDSTIPSHYATLLCGRAAPSGAVEICNGGHCPPLLVRAATRSIETIDSDGPAIGLFRDEAYTSTRIELDPGDLLFLYTDGLSESRDGSGAEYGVDRISHLLRNGWAEEGGARAVGGACLHDLSDFLAGSSRIDDLTLLVLRRRG